MFFIENTAHGSEHAPRTVEHAPRRVFSVGEHVPRFGVTLHERRFGKRGNLSATGLLNIITYVILLTIEDELYGPLTYVILLTIEEQVYGPLTYVILLTIEDEVYGPLTYVILLTIEESRKPRKTGFRPGVPNAAVWLIVE